MGLLDPIRRLFTAQHQEAQEKQEEKTAPPYAGGGLNYYSSVPAWGITDLLSTYTANSWVYAVVSKIAQAVSAVPWQLYTEDSDGNKVEITEGPIYDLLRRPNNFMSWQEFIELTLIMLELTGEAYWVISYNKMQEPAELWPVSPDKMSPVPDPEEFIAGYVYRHAGEEIPFDPHEVIHIKNPHPLNPYRGISPAQAAKTLIQNDMYAGEYVKTFFYNSALPSGIITSPKPISPQQLKELRERWNAAHRGISKAHKVAVLDGGKDFKVISYSLRELQLIDVRKQNRDDILAAWGVHASILGISENVNRANAEAAEYTFAKRIVEPRLMKLAGKINAELLPKWRTAERLTFEFRHEIPEDTDTLLRKVQVGVQLGIITVNEARNLLGLDDIKGGDVVLQPMNLIPSPVSYEGDDDDVDTGDEESPNSTPDDVEDTEEENRPPTQEDDAKKTSKQAGRKNMEWYRAVVWRRFVRQQAKFEKELKKALEPAWEKYHEAVKKAIAAGGGLDAIDHTELGQVFMQVYKEHIRKTYEYFLRRGAADVKMLQGMITKGEVDEEDVEVWVDTNLPHILEWLEKQTYDFWEKVDRTTIEMLKKELEEAYKNGEDLKQVMERVAKVFEVSAKGYRAERIARTETIKAANAGALEGYRQMGVRKKEWITAIDERTREWHAEADGQIVDIDDAFVVGGENLRYPGDPAASPENVINCRCTVAPVLD